MISESLEGNKQKKEGISAKMPNKIEKLLLLALQHLNALRHVSRPLSHLYH